MAEISTTRQLPAEFIEALGKTYSDQLTKKDKETTDFEVTVCREGTRIDILDKEFAQKQAIVDSIKFAKDLISEPSNVLYPTFKEALLKGSIDLDSSTVYVTLVSSSYTYSATDEFYSILEAK